jgi:hypothetical protein
MAEETWNIGTLKLLSEDLHNLYFFFARYNLSDEVKDYEMGRVCNTDEGEEECLLESQKERDH